MNAILILHGWGSCADNWNSVKNLLKKRGYEVFVPDLPGFGKNPPPTKSWSLDDYVEWVNEFCEKNNLSQIFLLGHSFGGSVAVRFTLKNPEKVKKLFLAAPALVRKKTLKKEIIKKIAKLFSFLPRRVKETSFLFPPRFAREVKEIVYKRLLKSDYPLTEGTMRETYLKIIKEDQLAELADVSAPTVIIWGENDDVTPIKDGYLINKKIVNSVLEVVSGVKHNLHSEAPEILVQKIIEHAK